MYKVLGSLGENGFELQGSQHVVFILKKKKKKKEEVLMFISYFMIYENTKRSQPYQPPINL